MITVLTWLWRQPGGRAKFEPWHVNVWAAMVRRNLTLPHRIACVTDAPEGIAPDIEIIAPPGDFEDVRLPTWREARPQCLRRIAMFAPDAAARFGERFVCMDLDCVVMGPLDPLFDRHNDFVMFRGTTPDRPYNGSMVLLTAGARPQVYTEFTPERAAEAGRRFVGSDQAWITDCLGPGEATWGPEHGVERWHEGLEGPVPTPERLLFFVGRSKPWDFLHVPSVKKHYRANGGGHGIVLGQRRSVWREAQAALERGKVDAVIAYPEAAEKWPGRVDAIAESRDEVRRIAAALGLERLTWCGAVRSEVTA